jgi:hypothetical protein
LEAIEKGSLDPACLTVICADSSGNVSDDGPNGARARRDVEAGPASMTADEALRLAIKLAVDAGDYERAGALLDVAKGTTSKPASVPSFPSTRGRART